MRSRTCRASETGHRLSARPGMGRGEARASQVPGPSSSGVPWSNTPPDTFLSSPTTRRGRCCLQVIQHSGHLGRVEVSGPHAPWPTRAHAYASPTTSLGSSHGLLPARAGSPFAGWDSHPLDDTRSFMESSSSNSLRPALPGRTAFPIREALALAEELHADLVLIDEDKGRQIARSLGLRVTGSLTRPAIPHRRGE